MNKIRWGIMGYGNIVHRWINGAMQVRELEISSIAGRTQANVDRFCRQYKIENKYYSYEDIAKSNDVDCIYVATPHTSHKELAMLAIKNGKHVLVEKPISVSEKDAAEMINCAKENDVLLMEAMWTRFFPVIDMLREIISSGKVGKVRSVHSAFSNRVPVDKSSRLFDPMQAGGGLLDVGVYPLHFSDIIYDSEPLDIFGYAAIGTDEYHIEVDEQATFISKYDEGAIAVMSSGIRTNIPDTAVIYTTEAMIKIPVFWKPTTFEIHSYGKDIVKYENKVELTNCDYIDEGFQYEIRHMCECIQKGIRESPVMTYDKSLSIMRQCDKLRRLWDLKYPFEI